MLINKKLEYVTNCEANIANVVITNPKKAPDEGTDEAPDEGTDETPDEGMDEIIRSGDSDVAVHLAFGNKVG